MINKQIPLELRWYVIADDLTGALDAVAPFAQRGATCVVVTDIAHVTEDIFARAQVVGLSTNSREIAPKAAAQSVGRALKLAPRGWRIVKKIDSRIKGNVAAELTAFGPSKFAVLPAIPEMDRNVIKGQVCGFGVNGPIDIRAAIQGVQGQIAIPDILSQSDMMKAVQSFDIDCIMVGARGMMRAAAELQFGAKRPYLSLGGKIGAIIGSHDKITQNQIAACVEQSLGLYVWPDEAWIWPRNDHNIIQMITDPPDLSRLPDFVQAAIELGQGHETWIVSGGATTQLVLDKMGIYVLDVLGECDRGLPLSQAGQVHFVTKSGGFGGNQTLRTLMKKGLGANG